MERTFQIPETVPLVVTVRDWDDALVDPTSITVTIYDPNMEVVVDEAAMDSLSTGRYVYYYQTVGNESGWYKVRVVSTDGTGDGLKRTIIIGGFTLQ